MGSNLVLRVMGKPPSESTDVPHWALELFNETVGESIVLAENLDRSELTSLGKDIEYVSEGKISLE